MHRLNADTGITRRPCDYFHWIGGVGAGGVVATLLVSLGMDAEEASVAFARICAAVLPDDSCSPTERASQLEAIVRTLLEEHGLFPDTKLLNEANPSGACKLGLFYMTAVNLGHSAILRSYPSRQASYNPTLIEAIKVVWATPGLFPPVHIGPGLVQQELVSAVNGFNNPTLEALKEVHQIFGPDAKVSCLLSLGAGRAPVRSFVSNETSPSKTLEQLASDCEKTADEIQRRIGRLGVYFRFSVDRGLDFDTPLSPMGSITAHTGQYLLDDHVNSGLDACIRSSDHDSRVTLEQLYRPRARNSTSIRGLPPLSAFFVMRQEPMNVLITNLIDNKDDGQRLVVLAGMGGSGKTQLTLKFARDYEESFQLIMFIDASSADTIKKGLLARIRALGRGYQPETIDECLDILADPEDPTIRDWLIIYDNADDPELDLRGFIPVCDNGALLVTTRNTTLKHMAPEAYLELDVMSPGEAVPALLQAALPSGIKPTARDQKVAEAITEQLGYLPIAVIQAGCYIRQQQCLYEYEERLKENRKATLERPAKNQRDTLKYGHSVYASLDITLEALSQDARHILSILSCVHFASFPRPLFSIAAKKEFRTEVVKLLDRPASFESTIQFLTTIFCPGGRWDEARLADLLEELQQYSLIALVPSVAVVTLRLHPLVHSWAQDRLSPEERESYRAAAVRLLACGGEPENISLYQYLTPHIASLSDVWETLHANDRIVFLKIQDEQDDGDDDVDKIMKKAQDLHAEVKSIAGDNDIRTSRAALFLAGMHGCAGDIETMEKMEAEIVKVRESLLGREDLETIKAMSNLAGTYITQERYNEAESLMTEVLKVRKEKLGVCDKDTAWAMETMAEIYMEQKRHQEAQQLLRTALSAFTTALGRAHYFTVNCMMTLADSLDQQDGHTEADALRQEALDLESTNLGSHHIETLLTMIRMAKAYALRGQLEEAVKLCEQVVTNMKDSLGLNHLETLDAIEYLASLYEKQSRYADSERLQKEELLGRKITQGAGDSGVLATLASLSSTLVAQGKREESQSLWKQELEERKKAAEERLDTDSVSALSNLASYLNSQKLFEELETLAIALRNGSKKIYGDDNLTTLISIHWLALAKLEMKNYAEAESLWTELLSKRKTIQGEKHISTLHIIGWLAQAMEHQGRLNEAATLREQESALKLETLGPKNVAVYTSMGAKALVYQKLGRLDDGEGVARQMMSMAEGNLNSMDSSAIYARSVFGVILHYKGQLTEAAAIAEQVIKDRVSLWGEKNLLVARGKFRLALTYEALGRYDEAKALAEQASIVQREQLRHDNYMIKETLDLLEKLDVISSKEADTVVQTVAPQGE